MGPENVTPDIPLYSAQNTWQTTMPNHCGFPIALTIPLIIDSSNKIKIRPDTYHAVLIQPLI